MLTMDTNALKAKFNAAVEWVRANPKTSLAVAAAIVLAVLFVR
jgi:ElaB/YqjD/DUF883 family membrane-anchored ribosome-binding protein